MILKCIRTDGRKRTYVPQDVGYRAPWRCSKCKAVIEHPSGTSGLVSRPNVLEGTEYQGLRKQLFFYICVEYGTVGVGISYLKFPQWRKRSKLALMIPSLICSVGPTRWGAPLCIGYEGAVAIMPASAPVGVGPGYPTSVGKRVGSLLVGVGGGY